MAELSRKDQSLIKQMLEEENQQRLYGPLLDAGIDKSEMLNILGQDQQAADGTWWDKLHSLFVGTDRTEFPEVPEMTDKRTWEAMGGDPEQLYYGGGVFQGNSRYTTKQSAKIALGRAVTEDDYQLAGIVQETSDDVFLTGAHQGFGNVLAQTLAHRNGELMRHRAVLDGFDQIGVLQDVALDQDGMGNLILVIGQRDDQGMRRIGALR